jgi:hypothetical protein
MESVEFDERPSGRLAWGVFFLVLIAAAIAALVYAHTDPDLNLDLKSFVIFAPIYAAAQAIERLLEPLAKVLLPTQDKKEQAEDAGAKTEQAKAAALALTSQDPAALLGEVTGPGVEVKQGLDEATDAKKKAAAELAKKQSERALVFFAIASCISLALCAVLGLGIITAMAESPPKEYLRAIDIALTGLVIGAGTKPLHDLISRVEKAKDKAASGAS